MEIMIYNNPDFLVEVNEENLIHFDYGIPGFEELKKFAIVDIEEYNPFLLLHSVEDYNIAMIVLNEGLLDLEEDLEEDYEVDETSEYSSLKEFVESTSVDRDK